MGKLDVRFKREYESVALRIQSLTAESRMPFDSGLLISSIPGIFSELKRA